MLSVWLRVIRVRFLLASVIAVAAGLGIHWRIASDIDVFAAILTMSGVVALHASVDLLNDFWDYKRGIDTSTKRTKLSGGTGVLPEGLLQPRQVWRAGVGFLIAGTAIGAYFVITDGIIVAAMLVFATVSIYFYSTKIVDSGLAEVFVAVKGAVIVVGAYYIQSSVITAESVLAGAVIGMLSSTVLFVTSFPDYSADKSKGRKTFVIAVGRQRAASVFWAFPGLAYLVVISCVMFGVFPITVLIVLGSVPLAILSGLGLRRHCKDTPDDLVPAMSNALQFSRITGILFVIGLAISLF